jgi:hypothetical protein
MREPFNYCVWDVPVAIAYQAELIYWQRRERVFVRDDRRELMEELGA